MSARARGMTVAVSIAVVLLAPSVRAPLQAQRVSLESLEALHRWGDAVNGHVPGVPDAAVRSVVAMTYAARLELNTSFPLFMRVLREDFIPTKSELERGVTAYARMIRNDPGTPTFLKRAAILHADAVVFASRFPSAPDDAPPIVPEQRSSASGNLGPSAREKRPPLLTNERITMTRDGQVLGDAKVNWNLPFARSLFDVLLKQELKGDAEPSCENNLDARCRVVEIGSRPVLRDDYEFVAAWYHAVAAYLFARGMNGDAKWHLEAAARVLPDDPHLLFDRATYAEWFGLPIYQVIGDGQVVAEDKTNAEAERQYRRTLDVDPAYVEARVRLARLLDRRGRHDEAAAEVATALDEQPEAVVAFYAHVVAGHVASARGRYEEALGFYREASRLYGHAQSALLGASHAALMLADVPEALAPLARLGGAATQSADPWLDYGLGAGRDVNPLLIALWARAPKS
jgi:tetratricopeptide (TPR) repeat protein